MNLATTINNYEYLDILDRAWTHAGSAPSSGGVLCDVGCASFWYAATLQAFFCPSRLVGVEVEGHRLFKDGHTRIDYASGYLADIAAARFIVANYLECALPAKVITAWFPFVTAPAILAWRLPLSLLAPPCLFARIGANLEPGGTFLMVNQGDAEEQVAGPLCSAAGLRRQWRFAESVFGGRRNAATIVSAWTRP